MEVVAAQVVVELEVRANVAAKEDAMGPKSEPPKITETAPVEMVFVTPGVLKGACLLYVTTRLTVIWVEVETPKLEIAPGCAATVFALEREGFVNYFFKKTNTAAKDQPNGRERCPCEAHRGGEKAQSAGKYSGTAASCQDCNAYCGCGRCVLATQRRRRDLDRAKKVKKANHNFFFTESHERNVVRVAARLEGPLPVAATFVLFPSTCCIQAIQ